MSWPRRTIARAVALASSLKVSLMVSVVLLLLLVLALAPGTETGTRFIVQAVTRLAPLQITYGSGTLTGDLHLQQLRVPQDNVSIELADITATLGLSCLWRGEICLEKLHVAQLSVDVLESSQEPSPAVADTSLFEFPLPISVADIALNTVDVSWSGGRWHNGALRGAVHMRGTEIRISAADVNDALLQLSADDSAPGAAQAATPDPAAAAETLVLPKIHLPVRLVVEALQLIRPAADFYGARHSLDLLSLAGSWEATELQLQRLDLEAPQWGQLALAGELQFAADWPLSIAADGVLAEPPVWSHLHHREVQLQLQGDAGSLQLQGRSAGEQTLQIDATLDLLSADIPFNLDARLSWPEVLDITTLPGLPPDMPEVSLASPLLLSAGGSVASQHFTLQGEGQVPGYSRLDVTVAGEHQAGRVALSSVELRDHSTDSVVSVQGDLEYGERLAGQFQLASPGFDLPALDSSFSGRLQGALGLQVEVADAAWRVAVQDVGVSGVVNELPAKIAGSVLLSSRQLLHDAQLDGVINGARWQLNSLAADPRLSRLKLTVDDLGRWQKGSAGRFELAADLDAQQQSVQFNAAITDLDWQGLAVAGSTVTGSLSLADAASLSLDVTASDVGVGGAELEELRLQLQGDEHAQGATLSTRGNIETRVQVSGKQWGEDWHGSFSPATIETPYGAWELAEALPLSWKNAERELGIAAHCWRKEEVSLCADSPLRLGPAGTVAFALVGDLSELQKRLPATIQVRGRLAASLFASWSPHAQTQLRVDSNLTEAVFTTRYGVEEPSSVALQRVEFSLWREADNYRVHADLNQDRNARFTADMELPTSPDAPLHGQLEFEDFNLMSLQPLLPSLSQFEGLLQGRVNLSGTLEKPLATGTLNLADGHIAARQYPNDISDLEMTVQLRGEQGDIAGMGSVGEGELTFAGVLQLAPQPGVTLTLSGDHYRVLVPPHSEAQVSHELTVSATAQLIDIKGGITVHSGLLQPEQLPTGSVEISSDAVEVDLAGNVVQQSRALNTRIGVRVKIEDKFLVRSREISGSVGGDLQLVQEPGRPLQLFGSLNVLGGSIRAYGQRLEIRRGTMVFVGEPGNPDLNLRAEREISGEQFKVGVAVRGTVEEPVLTVYSTAAMTQAEALSYLVRAQGLESGGEGDDSAMAVSMGAGVINQTGVLSGVNRLPGVSNVEFGSESSEEGTAATIGGYLGENIYLSYGVGLYEPITLLTARLYLMPRLWLEVVSSLENSADVYYSFFIN